MVVNVHSFENVLLCFLVHNGKQFTLGSENLRNIGSVVCNVVRQNLLGLECGNFRATSDASSDYEKWHYKISGSFHILCGFLKSLRGYYYNNIVIAF